MLSSTTYIFYSTLCFLLFIQVDAHGCCSFTFTTPQYFMNILQFTFSFSRPWIFGLLQGFFNYQKILLWTLLYIIHIYIFKSFSRAMVLKMWSCTSSLSVTWDLVSKTNIWTPSQSYWVRNSGDGDSTLCFNEFSRRFWCTILRTTARELDHRRVYTPLLDNIKCV